jgi:toxin CcdB
MAQFDVYRIADQGLAIDCQSDWLADLRSRIVVPLRPFDDVPIVSPRLNPIFMINGERFAMATQFMRSVDSRYLTDRIASLDAHEFVIKTALDMLVSGY